jgi:hypothetical protein
MVLTGCCQPVLTHRCRLVLNQRCRQHLFAEDDWNDWLAITE